MRKILEVIDERTPTQRQFSSGIKIDQFIFCSGIGETVRADRVQEQDFRETVIQTLKSIERVLNQGGASLEHVYQTYVFVKDMDRRPIVNEVCREYYKQGGYPTRVIAEVSNLMDGREIEIVCNAYVPQSPAEIDYLHTKAGHIPTGPFSQGVKIGNYIYCSGVRPLDPETQKLIQGDFRQRVRQCFENLKAILAKGEATLEDVYSTIVYVKRLEDRPIVNEVTQEYFPEGSYPLRVFVEIDRLNEDHDVEIECNAYLGEKAYLTTVDSPLPSGPFAQGVKISPYIHCSGVLPLDPQTQKVVEGDFECRVRQCLKNLKAVLNSGGADMQHVYSTTVYLRDIAQVPTVDQLFAEYFAEENKPVRHIIEISRLCDDLDVEIACSAYLDE